MADLEPENIPFYWANLFLYTLSRHGVDHVIISPGSRSTPLTLASVVNTGLQKHVILDERSASYTALGIGKSTGQPAALICTSGSAAANYYPAVIESRQSGVPLIVLTADRPPHLRGIGANQAIDQLKLFGTYPVWFHETGEPNLAETDTRRLMTAARQAIFFSQRDRGPVHLNFAFRKPLEPSPSYIEQIKSENQVQRPTNRTKNFQIGHSLDTDLPELVEQLHNSERPILIAGPEDPSYSLGAWAIQLAADFNIPILSEPGSQLPENDREVTGFAGYLRNSSIRIKLSSDLIVRIGRQPTTNALHQYLTDHRNTPHHHFTRSRKLQDAQLSTNHTYEGIPGKIESQKQVRRNKWWKIWKDQMERHKDKLKKIGDSADTLTDGQAIQHLLGQIPEHWALVLSNSFPVRDAALFGDQHSSPRRTFVNRGTSGIDGITSTAAGVSVGLESPTLLVAGDLAFLHDTNALLNQSIYSEPLIIAVINNGGGSIFRMLPIAKIKDSFTTYFETPQQVDISSMAETYHTTYGCLTKSEHLDTLSLKTYEDKPGIHLLEFRTDPDRSMEQRQELWNG